MNTPRLLLAIAVGFVFLFASDFLVHHFWLGVSYKAAAHLWRPEADMNAHLPWLFAGQLLCAVTFVLVWALGFAGRSMASGIVFGILMGAFQQVWALINFAVFPLPGAIAAKWFVAGIVQAAIFGAIVAAIYRAPRDVARIRA